MSLVYLLNGPPARFWVHHADGFVRLRIRPGESLSHGFSEATEEGYHCDSVTWTHEGDHISRSWATRSQDCDGRCDRFGDDVCPLAELAAHDPYYPDDPIIKLPNWQDERSSQRDYAAEAMGY